MKLKNIHRLLKLNQSQRVKQHAEVNTHKIIAAEKNGDKDGKALYKLMSNAV